MEITKSSVNSVNFKNSVKFSGSLLWVSNMINSVKIHWQFQWQFQQNCTGDKMNENDRENYE